jgi:hypothetical protein
MSPRRSSVFSGNRTWARCSSRSAHIRRSSESRRIYALCSQVAGKAKEVVRCRWLTIAICALVVPACVLGWRRSDLADPVRVVVRVHGVVLDANRLPARIPVPWAAVVIEGLRGAPLRVGTVRTRANAQGEFDLQVPMREAWDPLWRGSIWAEAFGYDASSVLCCGNSLEATTCSPGPCPSGTSAYVEIGLAGSSPPALEGEAMRFLGLRIRPELLLAVVITLFSLNVIWGGLTLARRTWPHRLSWMPSGTRATRTTSLRLGFLALALSVSAAGMPWYEWTLRDSSGPYVFSGRVVREQSGVWGPPIWSWDRPPLPNEYLRKPLPSQDFVTACGIVCLALILLCLGVWLLSLRQTLCRRYHRGKATLITACAGLVLCIGIVLALGPWTLFEELVLAPMGFWHFQGTFTAALDRVRMEGPLTLFMGLVLARIAFANLWSEEKS